MTEDERRHFEALPGELTVFRGHGPQNAGGWSWTLDHDKAKWFAQRLHDEQTGLVSVGRVDKAAAVALFTGRGESEVVVDPKHVRVVDVVSAGGQGDQAPAGGTPAG